jgi:hypothetical protein
MINHSQGEDKGHRRNCSIMQSYRARQSLDTILPVTRALGLSLQATEQDRAPELVNSF